MTVEYVKTGSWNRDAEDYGQLAATAMPILYGALSMDAVPDRTDRAKWLVMENQKNMGSCAGQAITTCVELSRVLAGGDLVQLSRMNAYIKAQDRDNISGDRGSTISGNVTEAMQVGYCLESVWPYPNSYSTRVPAGYADATKYRIVGHSPCRSYDDCVKHIGLTGGAIDIGITWSNSLDRTVSNNRGLVSSWPGGSGGGHSVDLVDLCVEDFDGSPLPGDEPWLKLANSWSASWGRNGYCLLSPSAVDSMINERGNVVEGIFGCASPEITFQGG